jgi:hypothetical protein
MFTDADMIYKYTRAQGLEEGVLVDAGEPAREYFKWPVAFTSAVWERCVEWPEELSARRNLHQDQEARLRDVLWMAYLAAKSATTDGGRLPFEVRCVSPEIGKPRLARVVDLIVHVGPGDDGEPVITIMFPNED